MDTGSDIDGFEAAPDGDDIRLAALKAASANCALSGVVRVSRTTHWQIQLRVAEDIVADLGWADRCVLSVLVGRRGANAGKVRFLPAADPRAPGDGHKARLFKLGNARARTITIPARVLGLGGADFSVFTAPHEIDSGRDTLTIDLSSIATREVSDEN